MSDLKLSPVVDGLSTIICDELRALSSEYWQPRFQADQMDAELKFRRERVNRLRAMREEFENCMFGLSQDAMS